MKGTWATSLLFLAAILAMCAVSYFIGQDKGYKKGYQAGLDVPVQHDTVVQIDTVFYDHPVEKWREVEKLVYIPVVDTQIVHTTDSVFVVLERESRGYSGEDYTCQVSGVDPALDWIKVNRRVEYITNTIVEKRRWSLGVTAGPGVVWNGKIHGGVGIVAGITYNF